jgi:uncharacterized membrane protein YoaK (UPF0700 family)
VGHHSSEPLDSTRKAWLAIGLTWIAGFVDIVGYTVLDRILNANMSGNTVEIAFHFLNHNSGKAVARAWAVLLFVAGLFACALIHEACKRRKIESSAAITLGLEALLLVIFVAVGVLGGQAEILAKSPGKFYSLLALACAAMGLQNATLTRVGALSVRTTHVTGTLAKFAESGSRFLFWFYDETRGPREHRFRDALRLSPNHEDFKDAAITALLWIGFLAGAFCGVILYRAWTLFSLLVPISLLAILAATDLIRPITGSKTAERA